MAISVKKIELWQSEVDNQPGAFDTLLAPLAASGADLQVVLGYGDPAGASKGVLGIYPVKGKKSAAAASGAGMKVGSRGALLVQGDNRAGLGHAIGKALADAGVNVGFLVGLTLGKKFVAVYGFADDAEATKALALVKSAGKAPRRAPVKKAAAKKAVPAKAAAKKKPAPKKAPPKKAAAKRAPARKPVAKKK